MIDSLSEPVDEVISVESLNKRFGDLVAVDDISFSVRRGEVFGILGPNGAGKTTTLECIEGLQEPSSGRISVLGTEIARDPNTVKERIGVQLQASAYFDYLTLTEILELFGRFYSRRVPPAELLSTVGLEDKANTTVGKLSGGQQQRFTIAATLVNDPEVVFLDEPTAGLDPQARRNLWDFVQSINSQGRTIVLTTHYMEEAEFLCDRVAIMDQGRIVTLDTPTNLVRSLPVPYEVRASTLNEFSSNGLADLDCVTEVLDDQNQGFRLRSSDAASTMPALMDWVAKNDIKLTHLEVTPANLEDVFLSLTGRALRD
ncbi:MAG TPA: ABC transporter ATP-binding protein [Dehalococcoidia bacterium]|nr:ABC transporter ATP-binding protein [SAR202 cluster bacterium]HBD82717.1 ABC transporter [Dehalococcoidia bacterium]HCH10596.1 ABC transporter [Dehalococcoidia bacterium]HHZ61220.1 ABC transporter ATP-binding protein [Dehalococcoidia bacterium]HIM15836.1 ABC transporter ATP-binding protein [Dehalococcoidia bacterium]